MADDKLPEIDDETLAAVTGGASSTDQVTTMLQTLMSSIKDLAASRNSGSGSGSFMQMLPMMMMMRHQQAPAVQQAPVPTPEQDGWIKVS